MTPRDRKFWILTLMVLIAGFSQGMLLPVLAVMLEETGISSTANGFHASALYIGIILAAPFLEPLIRRFGYRPVILTGLITIILSLAAFPFWYAFWFWFALRLIIGIADNLIHFSTQVWISSESRPDIRGRNLAVYGLAFGLGFGAGPVMTMLIQVHPSLPFILSASLSTAALLLMLQIKNTFPETGAAETSGVTMLNRCRSVWSKGWVALLPAFAYGFLEAAIHGSYPVYAMRFGIDLSFTTIFLLPGFVIGSLITQIPLGIASDKIGRRRLISIVTGTGLVLFSIMPLVESSLPLLGMLFAASGMLLGSLFSLGIAYLADLVPPSLLPAGNMLAGVLFALGSMSGPLLTGFLIEQIGRGAPYAAVVLMLACVFFSGLLYREPERMGRAGTVVYSPPE
ncbi:MFS transporter [Alkalicoccus urumqiensis]|uniref:MFS transporter n=1 Tax=Alkalicoccus urumqiensis TaxID=1548213 RepID=A0A2P6MGN3_ALKUR|nr:MFS transporter [Alkalicoccus urumqiensis]PRO65431.1 MFS transporter [Alkalicoccus urumqiensis]